MTKQQKPKRRKKGRAAPRSIVMPHNTDFYRPVVAWLQHPMRKAINKVSVDPVPDELRHIIVKPFDDALAAMRNSCMQFIHFWSLIQSNYLLAYTIGALRDTERLSPDETEAMMHRVQLCIDQDHTTDELAQTISDIGERYRRTGRFGVTGDERRMLEDQRELLEEILDLCAIRTVYLAVEQATDRLSRLEAEIRKSKGASIEVARNA